MKQHIMMGVLAFIALAVLVPLPAMALDVDVTGKVCDASVVTCNDAATPAPGVWVQGKTNSVGLYTNVRGAYTVTVATYIDPSDNEEKYDLVAEDGLRCARIPELTPITRKVSEGLTNVNFKVSRDSSLPLSNPDLPKFYGVRNAGFDVGIGFTNPPTGPEPCWAHSGTASLIKAIKDSSGNFIRTVLASTGTDFVIQDLFGFHATLQPSEGDGFIAIRSEGGFIRQSFMVPKSRKVLHYDFTFACQAGQSACDNLTTTFASNDSRLDDTLQVQLVLPAGTTGLADGQGANAIPPQDIGCSVSGTTITCLHQFNTFGGQLGWRPGKMNLEGTGLDGSGQFITLTFNAINLGTCSVCAVLVDNVRFNTVFMTANIVKRANQQATDPPDPDRTYVETQVRHTNELISQSGTNVRLRRLIPDLSLNVNDVGPCFPNGGLVADLFNVTEVTPPVCDVVNGEPQQFCSCSVANTATGCDQTFGLQTAEKELPTFEETSLVCLGARGLPNSDVAVNYVPKLDDTGLEIFGVAITREQHWRTASGDTKNTIIASIERGYDFVSGYNNNDFLTLKNQTAILIEHFDLRGGNLQHEERFRDTVAHEFGHLLISGDPQERTWMRPQAGHEYLEHNISITQLHGVVQPNLMAPPAGAPAPRLLFTGEEVTIDGKTYEAQVGRWDEPVNQPGPRCENVGCPH